MTRARDRRAKRREPPPPEPPPVRQPAVEEPDTAEPDPLAAVPEAEGPASHTDAGTGELEPMEAATMPQEKLRAGEPAYVPVQLLETVTEGHRVKYYVRARGAHAEHVSFPTHDTRGRGDELHALVTFLERTETELLVGNPADGLTYRLHPELELQPAK